MGTSDIGQLDLEKADGPTMLKAARRILKKDMSGAGKRAVAAALTAHFSGLAKEAELLECGDCGGTQEDSLKACPYCGSVDEGVSDDPDEHPKLNGMNGHASGAALLAGATPPKKKTAEAVGADQAGKLDHEILELRRIKGDGAAWAWRLGKHVHEKIYAPNLWTARKGDDGKPLYKGFAPFCEAEIGLSSKTVYAYMEISQRFSEEDARKIGITHMRMLAQAPSSAEAELKQLAEAGVSKKKFEECVKEARAADPGAPKVRKGVGGTKTGAAAASAAAAEKAAEARKKLGVTLRLADGKTRTNMLAKPLSKKDEPKQAKRLADQPWCVVECANGVQLFAAVVESASGHLVLVLEPRRPA